MIILLLTKGFGGSSINFQCVRLTFHVAIAFGIENRVEKIFGLIIRIESREKILSQGFSCVFNQSENGFARRQGQLRWIVDWTNGQMKNETLSLLQVGRQ